MPLSHATELTSNFSDIAFNHLNAAIKSKIEQAQKGVAFEQVEKEIHTAFIEAGRAVLSEALEKYDINLPTVMLEGKKYRQVVRCEQTYTSAVGLIRVERSLYRHKSGNISIFPLELRTGIVEGNYSHSG
ncbi:MAG: hypothetical protein L3J01_02325 [Thiomicrorhabdus sp.]|nr:hypothetical protein [Thiomicrorhabdus sp.]